MTQLEIKIDNPGEGEYLNEDNNNREEFYLENFIDTLFVNLKPLNYGDGLTITGFKDKRYLRKFETAFLKRMAEDAWVSSGNFQRHADELNGKYTIGLKAK